MRILALILLCVLPMRTLAGEPQPALSEARSAGLPISGKMMGIAADGLVVAADDGDGAKLMLLDLESLTIKATTRLNAPILALAVREDQSGAALLTGQNGVVALHRFGQGLQLLRTTALGRLDGPALSLTAEGRAVVTARDGDVKFALYDAEGLPTVQRPVYEAGQALAGAWVVGDVAYFNAATGMRLSAADLVTGVSYSDYQVYFKDGRTAIPFSVAPLLADRSCRGEYQTEFLLADAEVGTLTLLRADTDRSILRQIAEASVNTRETVANAGAVLIASSCNGAAVWLVGATSRMLSQFSIVREGDRLEQVGAIPLSGPVAALTLDWSGKSGWVLLRDQPQVIRFELSQREPPPLPGDDAVRELQRLLSERGFPVGAVDGVIGDRTRRATSLIGLSTGRILDIRTQEGVTQAIEILKEVPAVQF